MKFTLVGPLALMLALTCASPPQAQARARAQRAGSAASAERVEALAQAASELVRAGDFLGAISRFEEAYRLEPAAALLYNIAFVYDLKLGDVVQARVYYERYLVAPDADADGSRRARERLASLNAPRPIAPRAAPVAPPPPRRAPAPRVSAPVAPPEDLRFAVLDPPAKHTTAWALVGVGGVAMTMAAGFLRMAGATADEANTTAEPGRTLLSARTDDQELIAWSMLGGGAATAITGAVMLLLSDDDDDEDTALRWSPALAPGVAGVGFEARW
jgi:tetratricopeptide (TPR) repeat protein